MLRSENGGVQSACASSAPAAVAQWVRQESTPSLSHTPLHEQVLSHTELVPRDAHISGRSRPRNNTQCSCSAVGRPLGQRWILEEGLRVGGPGTPPFGARGRSSVRYGTRLGDLKENWFLLFST